MKSPTRHVTRWCLQNDLSMAPFLPLFILATTGREGSFERPKLEFQLQLSAFNETEKCLYSFSLY